MGLRTLLLAKANYAESPRKWGVLVSRWQPQHQVIYSGAGERDFFLERWNLAAHDKGTQQDT